MIFLETSFLVDYLSEVDEALEFLEGNKSKPFFTSSVTFFELYRGALRSENPEENLEVVENRLDWLNVVEMGKNEARETAVIEQELREKGEEVNLADTLIAGIARKKGATLVTADADFRKVEDLDTLNYKD